MQLKGKNKLFLKNMVESASPMQLIVVLYDGAIQWLQMGKKEIQENTDRKPPNWSAFSQHMDMTLKILTHLQETLDHTHNENLAQRLFDLYDFLKNLVIEINAYKREKDIDDAIGLLRSLKKSWQDAMLQQAKQSKASE